MAAAGLAHETKNPLGIVRGFAQRISQDQAEPAESRTMADHIVDAVDRAPARLGEFMTYASVRELDMSCVDVSDVLDHVHSILKPDTEEAGVILDVQADHVRVAADRDMLCQILINLLLNSLQSRFWARYDLWMAGSMMTVVPVMIIYAFSSRYLIRGVAMTGLKA